MMSIHQIAEQCGVSAITVSRALDPLKSGKVKPSTREKILSVCAQEKFYPSFSARSLASGRTRCVGFILPGMAMINTPQAGIYLDSFNRELEKADYKMLLLPVPGTDWESIRKNAEPIILSGRCDSYVVAAFSVALPPELPVTVMQPTSSERIADPTYPVIGISNHAAMRKMVRHLVRQKYRRPAVVRLGNSGGVRAASWEAAFEAENQAPPALVTLPFAGRLSLVTPLMLRIFQEHRSELEPYDAWIFPNDLLAMLAVEMLRLDGREPGRDVGIVGFDNIERDMPSPQISTISPPLKEYGRAAAKLALDRIRNPHAVLSGVRIDLDSEAVFRDSTERKPKIDHPIRT